MDKVQRTVSAVESHQDLDDALAEMARLTAKVESLQTACNHEIEASKSVAQGKAVCLVDGKIRRIPERLAELDQLVAQYAEDHKSELIPNPDKKKSVKLTHGEIGWRAKRRSVQDVPELEDGQASIIKRLITAVISLFGRLTFLGLKPVKGIKELKADRIFSVKVEVKRAAVLDLYQNEQITDEQLQTLGLKVVGGEDEFWIKPAAVAVTAHAGAAA